MSTKGDWSRVSKHPAYRDNLEAILAHSKKKRAAGEAPRENRQAKGRGK